MPRLICTGQEFVRIIERHGFVLHRHDGGSHKIYRAVIGGHVYLVTCAVHNMHDEIPIGTLKAMIRQSGLKDKLFRK